MKSMYPKQKSYIPRFALIINTFDAYVHQTGNPTEITKESILKAEKLSDYFVSVAKKIKVNSANTQQMKTVINKSKEGNLSTKIESLYKANPDFNRSEAAELLGCSRQTIYNHIKKFREMKIMVKEAVKLGNAIREGYDMVKVICSEIPDDGTSNLDSCIIRIDNDKKIILRNYRRSKWNKTTQGG